VSTRVLVPEVTRAQLLAIVRTGKELRGVGKMRALAALRGRDVASVRDVLQELAADRQEAPRFRHMAVMGLYAIGGARASQALSEAAQRADESSATPIAVGLGRVGPADSLAIVERLGRMAPAHARRHAQFAETLLAYRHRLDDHDVRAPAASNLLELARARSMAIDIDSAPPAEAAKALEALADEPLEIGLTTDNAQRILCDPEQLIWLWTRETASRGLSALTARKGVAGALFRRRPFEEGYSLSEIGLGTPTRGGSRLTLHRADSGRIMYSGTFAEDGSLVIKARNEPGVAAVAIEVQIDGGRVTASKARSASTLRNPNVPKRS
jgi:hypothetical protein